MIADFAVIFISFYLLFFFFNDTATTEIYTLSLHDALPIYLVEVPNTIHGQLPAVASVIGLDPESEFLFVMTAKQDVLSLDLGSGRVDTVVTGIVQAALGPDGTLYTADTKRRVGSLAPRVRFAWPQPLGG